MTIPTRTHFEEAYAGKAPWDIGRPQQNFVAVAGQIRGSILDAGCGTGDIALYFAERGHKVTGIDYLHEPIERAQKKAAKRGLEATFLVMDATELVHLKETFDTALDIGLFHVFDDLHREEYVAGLTSVVKPGGKLFLLCFSDSEPGEIGPRRVSERELKETFCLANGWSIESLQPTQFEVRPDLEGMNFTPGGPRAWFVVARRV